MNTKYSISLWHFLYFIFLGLCYDTLWPLIHTYMHILWYQKLFTNKGSNRFLIVLHLFSVGGDTYIPWCTCVVITGQPAGVGSLLPCELRRTCVNNYKNQTVYFIY